MQHALTLETDRFGNVLKSVAIGYGRRTEANSLPSDADRNKQTKTLATLVENTYTTYKKEGSLAVTDAIDEADIYRTPLACEAISYELTGPGLTTTVLSFENVKNAVALAQTITYEATATSPQWQKRIIEHAQRLYRKDDLSGALEQGRLDPLALPFETYTLAFTPGLLEIFKRDGQDLLLPNAVSLMQEAGYRDLESDGHYWIPSGRTLFHPDVLTTAVQELAEARAHFFSPRRYRDAFGQDTLVTLDIYDLLPLETKDALRNTVRADNDYRVLQPFRLTDANENQVALAFDALGLVVGTAVLGKPGQLTGDTLAPLKTELTRSERENFFSAPRGEASPAVRLLEGATTRIIYDVDRFQRLGEPPFAATLSRETHVGETSGMSTVQISFSYSDGFGREIQKKIQAEPGSLVEGGAIINPRWVGSGWTVFNNKGKPVKQYEPFFDDTHEFKVKQEGVTPTLFYDPVGRVVATLHPNHSYEKVVFNPWEQTTYDVNDTVLTNPAEDADVGNFFKRQPPSVYIPIWYERRENGGLGTHEQEAATKAAAHANTPSSTYLDSLGRPFLTITRKGLSANDKIETRTTPDIEGNQREVTDARNLTVMRYDYSLLGQHIHQTSMDAGQRWLLNDVTGKPLRAWDSRGRTLRTTYDELRRPVRSFVTAADETNPNREILFEHILYGDSPDPELTLTAQEISNANLRGRTYKHFDGAGVITNEAYDVKGNLLHSTRRLVQEYKTIPDWSQNPVLETETFSSSSRYDALNRPVQFVAPHSNEAAKLNIVQPGYNEANLLEQVDVWLEHAAEPAQLLNPSTANFKAVTNINYNAKGQRTVIVHGNNTRTTYEYDPLTFRLTNLRTTNDNGTRVFQNLSYTYDPVGNITHLQDDAQQTVYFNNAVVQPHNDYLYDALYRLIEASGREHLGQTGNQPANPPVAPDAFNRFHSNLAHPNNGAATGSYKETYSYDKVGNILELRHQGTNPSQPGWKRCYQYALVSNRLLSTTNPNDSHDPSAACPTQYAATQVYGERYDYDAHGNMMKMPHLPVMRWDFKNQLQATAQQVVNDGTPETTYYVYDAGGQRVRKVTEFQAQAGQIPKRKEERIYLGGFEIFRSYEADGAVGLAHETLHLMDGQKRIALVETKTKGVDETLRQLIRYQYGNHLGSASLELDDTAQVISYEEYFPYGTTAYQAVDKTIKAASKRYRYTGKERDEETGLTYHSARYYALWLTRCVSTDPLGLADGLNLYAYTKNNPVNFHDPSGTLSEHEELPSQVTDLLSKIGVPEAEERSEEPSFFESVGNAFSDAWEWLKGAASSAWNWTKDAVSTAWNWTKGAISSAWNWTKKAASAAWSWFKGAASTAWNWTKKTAGKVWDWLAGDDGFFEDAFEVIGHLTWGSLGTAVGLAVTAFNLTVGNLITAIHNAFSKPADDWEYASISIGGPNDEDDIIGNYGGLFNLGGLGSAVTLGPFVFFQGSKAAVKADPSGATDIQDYFRKETGSSIYQSKQNLRTADHEEGHEDQNLLYGPFTLFLGLGFSLIPNALGSSHSSGWYWYDRQANRWSGKNNLANPNTNVHP